MARPQRIDLRIELKLLSRITRSELSLATSQPLPMHKPTSACLSTSASEIPSPAIPINPPCCWIPRTKMNLSSGVALAMILSLFLTLLNLSGLVNYTFLKPVYGSMYILGLPIASLNSAPVIAVPSILTSAGFTIPDLTATLLQVSI